MDERQQCFVANISKQPKRHISKQPKRPMGEKTLSAQQPKKGLRKGKHTYVAALIEIKPDKHVKVLDAVVPMLKRFEDVMLLELPKKLPPRRKTDHQIGLI